MRAPQTPSDDQLVAAALRQDEDAFGELVRRYQDYLFHLCWRVVGDRGDAQDLTQETFLKLHRHLDRLRPGHTLGNWLYTVALNHCRQRLRRRRLAAFFSLDARGPDGQRQLPEPSEPGQDPLQAAVASQGRGRLDAAVQGLPADMREAFVLRYELDQDIPQVAEALGRSQGATRVLLHRARLRLRQVLVESGLGGLTPPPAEDREENGEHEA